MRSLLKWNEAFIWPFTNLGTHVKYVEYTKERRHNGMNPVHSHSLNAADTCVSWLVHIHWYLLENRETILLSYFENTWHTKTVIW